MRRPGGRGLVWAACAGVPFAALSALLGARLLRGGWSAVAQIVGTQGGLLLNTVVFGGLTAVVATALGWTVAHVQDSYAFPGRRMVGWIVLVPLVTPSFACAMALVIVAGHNGWVTRWLGGGPDIYGLPGLVIAGAVARLPYAYLAMSVAYRLVDHAQVETAEALGASSRRVLTAVLWPRLRGAVVTVFLLVFADTVADLANPLVIGGGYGVVASRLYQTVVGEADLAAASGYAVLLFAPALAYWLASGRSTLGPARLDVRPLAPRRRPGRVGRLLIGVAWVTVTSIVGLLLVLVVEAFRPVGDAWTSAFASVLTGVHTRALATTVLLALVALPVTTAVAVGGTLLLAPDARLLRWGQRWCTVLGAVPNLVLGLAALLALVAMRGAFADGASSRVLGVFWLIVLVHVLRNAPAMTHACLGAADALVPDVRESATLLGARGWRLARLVYLPRLRPVLRENAVMTFARMLTATSSVILLADAQVPLLTVSMLTEVSAGRLATASAMTVTTGLLIGVAIALAQGGWRSVRTR